MKIIRMSERTSCIKDEAPGMKETLMEFTAVFNIVNHRHGLQFKKFSLKLMC